MDVNFLREEVEGKKVIKKLMDNCRQNINHYISNNQNPFSTEDKSQKPIKDSNGVSSISLTVNTETISQETLNISEAVVSTAPNTVKAITTNSSKVNLFITVRPRDDFSKTSNQDNNEHKKSNCHSDKDTNKDQSKTQRIYILGDTTSKRLGNVQEICKW